MTGSDYERGLLHGQILQHLSTPRGTNKSAVSKFGVSHRIVSCVLRGQSRRTDMDAPRNKRKKAKAAAHAKVMRAVKSALTRKITVSGESHMRCPTVRVLSNDWKELTKLDDPAPSPHTLRRWLKTAGWRSFSRPKRAHYQGDNKIGLAFCKQARWKSNAVLESLIFSDEHYVDANDHTCATQWAAAKNSVNARLNRRRQNVAYIMIWGAIGINYKSKLIFIERKMNEDTDKMQGLTAIRYKRMCLQPMVNDPVLKDGRAVLFMQDGASCHTANVAKNYLKSKGIEFIRDWPAHRPDLNPIECLWSLMNSRVAEKRVRLGIGATDLPGLKQAAQEVWDEFDFVKDINPHVRAFSGKVKACIAAQGGPV